MAIKSDQENSTRTERAPPEIKRNLRQPFMVHPRLAVRGEGIEILMQECVRLELDLRIAQVPADIRIGDLFWDGEKHNQCEQNCEQNGKTKQSYGSTAGVAEVSFLLREQLRT